MGVGVLCCFATRSTNRPHRRLSWRSNQVHRARPAAILCLVLFAQMMPALWRGTPARTGFLFQSESPLQTAARRAGGMKTLAGSSAVGALAGIGIIARLPIVNLIPFSDLAGMLGGALAGLVCTQLPRSPTMEGKLGDFCRDTGRAAGDFGAAVLRLVGVS
mmetsp:Transcript_16383/g.38422  ORF Transcript_16383/g.38422 Transcript_16383/m.38422 type:complete len:161 (+) Transcript_16383:65-547(+)